MNLVFKYYDTNENSKFSPPKGDQFYFICSLIIIDLIKLAEPHFLCCIVSSPETEQPILTPCLSALTMGIEEQVSKLYTAFDIVY
jgi:hypothetical protein